MYCSAALVYSKLSRKLVEWTLNAKRNMISTADHTPLITSRRFPSLQHPTQRPYLIVANEPIELMVIHSAINRIKPPINPNLAAPP